MPLHNSDDPSSPEPLEPEEADTKPPNPEPADSDLPVADPEPADSDLPVADLISIAEPVPVQCWRCERVEIPVWERCPACGALLTPMRVPQKTSSDSIPPREPLDSRGLNAVLVAYGLFLLTSVIWGWILLADGQRMTEDDVEMGTIVLEGLDAVLVLASLAWVGSVSLSKAGAGSGPLAWGLAGPALLLLIGGNLLYSAILRDFINPGGFDNPLTSKLTGLTLLLICLQPAIVEELFFRYVAFGVFHRIAGTVTAVWVTSVMFAMAHIYNPLGLPYLFVLGIALGVARRYGGLLLPMIMHFLHNLAVLAVEATR